MWTRRDHLIYALADIQLVVDRRRAVAIVALAQLNEVLLGHAHAAPLGHGSLASALRMPGEWAALAAGRYPLAAAAAFKNWVGDAVEQIPSQ